MKKLFKRASLILLTVCTVFACAFALSACNNMNYAFVIQNEDGTAYTETIEGLQICAGTSCYPIEDFAIDGDGKVTFTQAQVNEICRSETDVTEFSFHVVGTEGYAYDCSFEVDGAKEYICKLYR